ncbi:hypothetical protein COU74_04360 [Candidatus Peregrinibacteria bacterium CG10_big_fil_rev_8_21_14_0_10_36_19]|nr:MAG: hypothetical protein COU74_04360 [Candidatus Peregrinibacteria bacterium CG10_big_fil_rev_8_21_14_0_10_36_19]
MKKNIFTFLVIYFLTTHQAYSIAPITFSELSFKDTHGDWVELKINSEISSLLEIKNGKSTYTINPEEILNKNFILITLNQPTTKEISTKETIKKYYKKPPLNNNKGEICLYSNNINIECICWNQTGTGCINSKTIKRNQSVIKENNWNPAASPTPGEANGTESNNIIITEIFPNPKGTDSNREWVKIKNVGSKSVDLTNWKTNNTAINQTIDANATLIIKTKLPNKKNKVTLNNFTNKIVDEVLYPKAPEGLSYTKVKNNWIWTKPNSIQNQHIIEKTGYITNTTPLEVNLKPLKSNIQKELLNTLKIGTKISYLTDNNQIYALNPLNKTFFLHHIIHHLHKLPSSNLMVRIKNI